MPGVPCRCSRCHRVRGDREPFEWRDHPARLPGEVAGTCATCAELLRRTGEQRYVREGRALERARERGYGPALAGEDEFRGFREGDQVGETAAVATVQRDESAALVPREQAGMLAMATMSAAEFDARLAALKRGQERIKRIKQELMEEDAHYGVIPGTKKPTLLKPGAEVLCSIYGLRPDFVPTIAAGDGVTTPTLRVTMRCELHLGDIAGPVVAVGYGSANSWERKHRYRRGERTCPKCSVSGQIIKGKEEYGGGWLCWKSKGGCGAKWPDGAPEIEGQQVGDVANPDPYDLENTLVKMAKKRAHIDAALTGTASSDLFTQDLDEGGPDEGSHHGGGQKPAEKAAPARRERAAPAAHGQTAAAAPAPSGTVACPYCGSIAVAPDPKSRGWWRCNEEKCAKGFKPIAPAADPASGSYDEPWTPGSSDDDAGARG